jgi:hypothetical protein
LTLVNNATWFRVVLDGGSPLLQRRGVQATVLAAPGKVSYRVDLGGRAAEELPGVRDLVGDVRGLGDQVVAVRVP